MSRHASEYVISEGLEYQGGIEQVIEQVRIFIVLFAIDGYILF